MPQRRGTVPTHPRLEFIQVCGTTEVPLIRHRRWDRSGISMRTAYRPCKPAALGSMGEGWRAKTLGPRPEPQPARRVASSAAGEFTVQIQCR